MRAVILAAGRGARMGALTADRPKCLVRAGGRTLLDRQIRALRAGGVWPVGIVTGWQADAFADAVTETREAGPTLFRNPGWARSTMAESLAAAGKWLEGGPVLAAYGDIVYSPAAVRRLAASPADLAVAYDPNWRALWDRRFERPLDDAETFRLGPDGTVADIGGTPRHPDEVQGQYMGLLKITPPAWELMCRARAVGPEVAALDMTGLLRHLVRHRLTAVAAVVSPEPWCEFDHPSDLVVGRTVLRLLDRELGLAADPPAAARHEEQP